MPHAAPARLRRASALAASARTSNHAPALSGVYVEDNKPAGAGTKQLRVELKFAVARDAPVEAKSAQSPGNPPECTIAFGVQVCARAGHAAQWSPRGSPGRRHRLAAASNSNRVWEGAERRRKSEREQHGQKWIVPWPLARGRRGLHRQSIQYEKGWDLHQGPGIKWKRKKN